MTPKDSRDPEVTLLLDAVRNGTPGAADRLLDAVYKSLHAVARGQCANERLGATLNATALVNEAYLKVLGDGQADLENRRHLYGAFARAMQEALIDAARRRNAKKRGGDFDRVPLDAVIPPSAMRIADPVDLSRVLPKLQEADPRAAEVVRFKCFLDLSSEEIASILDTTPRTVQRDWQYAKAFLRKELAGEPSDESE
jgi:RNA polymerase sigma factor (TIGR02999 family)